MKKIILLLVGILTISYSYAQTGNPDSIKQLLQKDKEDTSRVLHLADLSYEYLESKPDTAMALALEALSRASRTGFLKGKAASLTRIGNVYSVFGNYAKAMEIHLQALQIYEKINYPEGKGASFNSIGVIHRSQEDYRVALNYFLKAKAIAEQVNDKYLLSRSLYNIGQCYFGLKKYDSASLYSIQTYNVANSINYSRVIGTVLKGMGIIDLENNQNIIALEHFRLSLPHLKKGESYNVLSSSYLGISKAFEKLQQKDSVLYYAKQALNIAQERGFVEELRNAARFLSFYYRKFNADSAFLYQDITKAANDSMFSQQKQRQFQSLAFDEKLRQNEIAAAEIKATEVRKHNLQYAAIAIGLITFIILFFALSRSIVVKTKFIEFFGVLGLLAVFEFINLFIHPYLSHATNDSPVFMLLILIGIGALLVPLHHRLEKWITKIMVEKNKKIR
ncbi:MAG: tetratricopeptide repeat protein, partial [Ferruginibacter sp.]|nr:tetratricopeptide repeat protein [Ferruginibacter sp.]